MALGQYLKDTQAELRHVAWPTRAQTIVFTALVALISVFVAIYLGLFDYLFTTGLSKTLGTSPATTTSQSAIEVTTEDGATSSLPIEVIPTE